MGTDPAPADPHAREYAVAWRGTDGCVACGCVRLSESELRLRGRDPGAGLRLDFADVAAVRIGRTGSERVHGARSVVLELRTGETVVMAPLAAGEVLELAEIVSECCS